MADKKWAESAAISPFKKKKKKKKIAPANIFTPQLNYVKNTENI